MIIRTEFSGTFSPSVGRGGVGRIHGAQARRSLSCFQKVWNVGALAPFLRLSYVFRVEENARLSILPMWQTSCPQQPTETVLKHHQSNGIERINSSADKEVKKWGNVGP